jgi:hypothetical protein
MTRAPVGAILLKLRQREISGQSPVWDDLAAQLEWARAHGERTSINRPLAPVSLSPTSLPAPQDS